jgi:hypothetical protein
MACWASWLRSTTLGLVTIDGIQKPPNKWSEFYKAKDADEVPLADVIKREFCSG